MSVLNRLLPLLLLSTLALTPWVDAQQGQQPPPPKAQEPKPAKQQPAGDAIDFRKQVWPILQQNCTGCHRKPYVDEDGRRRRPKGRVELDSAEGIRKAKRGKLVVAKQPAESLMIEVVTLPADDEDRMPPAKEGPPLKQEQIDVLRKWIEQGAEFGTWKSAEDEAAEDKDKDKDKDAGEGKGKSGSEPGTTGEGRHTGEAGGTGGQADAARRALAADLQPLAAQDLAVLQALHAAAAPVVAGSPLLRLTFYGHEAEVTDATLAALAPARQHIAELVLARTRITDQGLAHLRAMPRLLRLDLRQTRVGDDGMAALSALPALAELNLFGTEVGDAGLQRLRGAPALAALQVWQSRASAAGVAALQQARPDTRIVFLPALPEPVAADEQRPPPRRRR